MRATSETIDEVCNSTVLFVNSLNYYRIRTMPVNNKKVASKLRQIVQWILLAHVVEFVEAYCTPRDTARRSPQRSRRSKARSPGSNQWRYDTQRENYDIDSRRRVYNYESGRRYHGRSEFDADSGRRPEFDAESARRRADYESARRTDFDLSAPGVSRRSPESAPEGSVESPPEPAPSAPSRHSRDRHFRHRSQQYYESESSTDEPSSSTDGEEEEEEFGEFDPFATAPSLHSPDSGRSDPRYANAPRRNPSPYYYGDLFKTVPSAPTPTAPTVSTASSSRGPRYRKSASLDAPHVAARPTLPKRFSVAEDGFRELERSSSSSGESALMPPRRRGRDAAGCVCAASDDVEERRPSRSVFYVPAPLPRWPQEMSTRQIYETAFDCKIARSDDDLDDFDRVSNHPALHQKDERKVISSASSAFEAVERSEPDYKGRRKVTMKTDSVRRSKIPTIRQKRENESNVLALSEELEKVHIEDDDRTASTSQLPLRGYTPSPPSTAPLPTKFQQCKDGTAMNSIKSAPNLPQTQPAHPRLKDLRLPVKSLRARDTPTSSDTSMVDLKGNTDVDPTQRLRDSSRESRDGDDERAQSKDGIFLEIKGRPTSDSDTPELNRYAGPKGVGPIMEFKGRPSIARPRRKYSSTESMATSSSGGSMESLRSSTSEGDRSSSSSESRRSSSLSSHSSDSGNIAFPKSHHMPLSGFGHHPAKLHILSPISDKSSQEPASETSDNNRNNNSQKVSPEEGDATNNTIQTTDIISKPKRRALQNRNLLNLTCRLSSTGDAEIQGSDSGISIHSREGVDSRNAFISFKNSNSSTTEEERKDEGVDLSDLPFDMPKLRRRRAEAENVDLRALPFDMPKLRRKLRGQSLQLTNDFGGVISNASSSQSVQDLNQGKHREKLTLNFDRGPKGVGSSKGLHLNLGPLDPTRNLVDAALPLDRQGWYHGTLSRVEAESLLRDADEGVFLVRNSESAKHDYSLSLKSTRGFMHMRICRNTEGYTLGGAATAFPNVPTLMKHYVTAQKLPVRGAEHMALSTPLPAVLL